MSNSPLRRLSIGMVVRALPMHRLGGLEYHTLDLANALAERGHRVLLLTTAAPPTANLQTLSDGATVHHLTGTTPGNYSIGFFRSVEAEVRKLHAVHSFDVIHTQDFAGLLLRNLPAPLVTTIHGTLTSETPLDRRYMRHLPTAEKLKAMWRFKARLALGSRYQRMLQRPQAILVDSDYTRRELLLEDGQLRSRIHLVRLGLDFRRYPLPPDETHRVQGVLRIALLGRLQEMKGLRIAVEAAAVLRTRGVAFEMRIGGAGEIADELTRLIAKYKLSSSVKLHGRIPEQQLPAFLANSDVFLFPDLTQPAFGLVAVEAMHHGLPVVGARSGAIPEVVDDETGWLYDPWDVQELALLLARTSSDPDAIRAKGLAARQRAAQFSAATMAARTEDVYLSCLTAAQRTLP